MDSRKKAARTCCTAGYETSSMVEIEAGLLAGEASRAVPSVTWASGSFTPTTDSCVSRLCKRMSREHGTGGGQTGLSLSTHLFQDEPCRGCSERCHSSDQCAGREERVILEELDTSKL